MNSLPLASLLELPTLASFQFEPSMIAIVIPLAGMLFAFGVVISGLVNEANKRRLRHETIRHAIDKGQPVPPELLNDGRREKPVEAWRERSSPRNDRRVAIFLLAVAAAIFLFFRAMQFGALVWVAAFPAFIGIALLLNSVLDENDRRRAERSKPSDLPNDPR